MKHEIETEYESKYWKFYNANPKSKFTDDCVIRALAFAMKLPWEKVLRDLTEYSVKYGEVMFAENIYGRYLEDNGWVKHKQPVHEDGSKVKISDFLDGFKGIAAANVEEDYVVGLFNGYVWDFNDCSDRIIGNFWTMDDEKEE